MRGTPILLLGLAACAGAAADHERLGDGHYLEGAFTPALAEYQAAQRSSPSARVWAKLGAAALRAGDAAAAVTAYENLARDDGTRVAEAARGLERAARLAARSGPGTPALTSALVGLRRVAPDRPLGRLARDAAGVGHDTEYAASLLPAAIAAADASPDVNRLLLRYADGLRVRTACEQAARVYRTALRRIRDTAARREAGQGFGICALQLGHDAMATERYDIAEGWFDETVRLDPFGPVGLRARLGWGDARLRQGDVLGAAIAWEAVRATPGAPDSLRGQASQRISELGRAGEGDTSS